MPVQDEAPPSLGTWMLPGIIFRKIVLESSHFAPLCSNRPSTVGFGHVLLTDCPKPLFLESGFGRFRQIKIPFQIHFLRKIKSKSKSHPNQILDEWQVSPVINGFRVSFGISKKKSL
jgi:hypothetical protein